MSGLTIELAGLAPGVSRVRLEADPPELGLDASEWPGRVGADLSVQKSGERVSIRGTLSATTALECVRCLRQYRHPIAVHFEVFAERSSKGARGEEAELELGSYMKFHDGRQLNLHQEAHDALLLEVPIAPLCRDDCRGLCRNCGADLNEGPCVCGAGV